MTGHLPGAMVIGAPKTGTTTLCAALGRVDGIWMYPRKETHFFNDHYQSRGMDWYRGLFRDAPDDALVMEGTPDYAMAHEIDAVMARIARHIPDARLIYMTRDPVDRVESHLVQMMANHRRILSLRAALAEWPEIVETSDYEAVLARIHRHFAPDRVLVLSLEDYAADRRAVHDRVLAFLGYRGDRAAALAAMDAQGILHKRDQQGMDGAILARLRRSRHFDRLHARVPAWIVALAKARLRHPLRVDEALPDDLRHALDARLRPGWERLCGAKGSVR